MCVKVLFAFEVVLWASTFATKLFVTETTLAKALLVPVRTMAKEQLGSVEAALSAFQALATWSLVPVKIAQSSCSGWAPSSFRCCWSK